MNHLLSLQDVRTARRYYDAGYWQSDTMYMRVRHWAEQNPQASALRDCDTRLNWGEVLEWVDRVAAELHASGVRPGQRVAIWLPSRLESVIVLLACSRMGYVANTSLHRDYTCENIVALLERANSVVLFAETGYGADGDRNDIVAMAGALPRLRRVFMLKPLTGAASPYAARRDALAAGGARATELPFSTAPDRVMYLAFTSGTTGLPKGVMHSDNTLLSNGRAIAGDGAWIAARCSTPSAR